MFAYDDFRKILVNTIELTKRIKTCAPEDTEELKMRIDSGIHAMKRIVSKIEDPDTVAAFNKSIESLSTSVMDAELPKSSKKVEKVEKVGESDLVEEELLRSSTRLKEMAGEFKKSLQGDKRILSRVAGKMAAGSQESSRSLKVLDRGEGGVKSSTFLSFTFMIFIFVYFLVRFA